eukprot:TRINITY_DN13284_c0_g1_i1.p1 TRINITY_DN13284_c0_g1~~TRINITY_DN13284_c0_g1_i1.p1  ORF type:complete len:222 (-),score=63.47 TRINITY_DN13284_c0_g1_i1:45-710(-)
MSKKQSNGSAPTAVSSSVDLMEDDDDLSVLPPEVQETIARFDVAFKKVEELLAPFFSESWKSIVSRLTPFEAAKLNVAISYAINTLFYLLLKTQGASTRKHPVMKELERVKLYIGKLKEFENSEKVKSQSRLNVEAANRFISHALTNIDMSAVMNKDKAGNTNDDVQMSDATTTSNEASTTSQSNDEQQQGSGDGVQISNLVEKSTGEGKTPKSKRRKKNV